MTTKKIVLCTASAAALLMSATLACAQDASPAPATGPDPAAAEESTTVVVTGLRRSIASARNLKKNADQIVDAIVAEDIGKLPDTTASDSLARVTGVMVQRSNGEASQVLVRGLPNIATSYNGRDIFTAEARYVAVQDFPAGGVAALEVFKSTTADQVEGGIAGLINVRSRRPFDFKGFELSGELRAMYSNQADQTTPNGNLLISDRWSTSHGEFGALLNLSYTRLQYLDSARWVGGFIATMDGARTPDAAMYGGKRYGDYIGEFYGQGDRTRPSVNVALQWRPNESLELYSDFLYQGFDNKVSDHQLNVPLWVDPGLGTTYSNITLKDDNQIAGLTVTNAVRPETIQGATHNTTDTYQFAVGANWNSGPWKVNVDLATTESKYNSSIYSFDGAFASSPVRNVTYDVDKEPGGVTFDFVDFDVNDPANMIFRGFFDRHLLARGRDVQFRTDVDYNFASGPFSKFEFGYRYVGRRGAFDNGERYKNREGDRIALASLGLDLEPTSPGFRNSSVEPIVGWVGPTYDSIREHVADLRDLADFAEGEPPYNPDQHFDADETSQAIYGQLHYGFNTRLPIDGVIGLRVVETKEEISGSVRTGPSNSPTYTPLTDKNDYIDLLPSISMQVRFSDSLKMRLAANKTRTRPDFAQMNPTLLIDPTSHEEGPPDARYSVYGASSGNIDLRPYESSNYDATLESYFSTTGYATFDIFRRDVSGFILYHVIDTTDPVLGVVRINQPYNAQALTIQGAEAQLTTFFDFGGMPDWASNFGVQLNATFIDADKVDGAEYPGVSKYSYNVVGIYENGPFSARLAYNYRSKWLNLNELRNGGNPGAEYTKPVARLDASANWNINDHVSLSADISNILGVPYRSYRLYTNGNGGYMPRDVRYEETISSLAVRFRY